MHQPFKHVVDRIDDRPVAPEIHLQIDPLPRGGVLRKEIAFSQEQLRARLPELIDALLDVADHKEVAPPVDLAGNGRQQLLLKHIGVLILIDHDLLELAAHHPCFLGGNAVFIDEDLQGDVCDRRKIVCICLFLLVKAGVAVSLHKPAQTPQKRHALALVQKNLLREASRILCQLFHGLFVPRTGFRKDCLPLGVHIGIPL